MSNKHKFQTVEARPNFGEMSEKIIKFWKDNSTFQKSVDQRPDDKPYIFYDGPPFVTGLPHYGSLLPSIAKDLIPRYQTMKGKKVRRVWGWDCHGLPIENKVEEKLGLKTRRDIEKIGLDKFIAECLSYVSTTSSQWEWYIDHIGRWVDFEHAYKTMDLPFMESVMWAFKTIYDKGLIYQGKRVSLYCPRDGTPISNFEVAMDNSYSDVTEDATTYKYQISNIKYQKEESRIRNQESSQNKDADLVKILGKYGEKTYILAWSTTPWTKLATTALAINPKFTYVLVKQNDEYYILAKTTLGILKKEPPFEIVAEFPGTQLEGLHFEPHFDYYDIPEGKLAYVIVGGDFVTDDEGTGVVTLAAYGEEDFFVMNEKNIAIVEHLDSEGKLTIDREPWKGMYYIKANKLVDEDLRNRGLIYQIDTLTHSVPNCWRCGTRLYYAPQDAWFLRVSQLKPQLFKTNENINWFPKHLKHGRFAKGIESAPDWCVSRTRYWATPMPVWVCEKCTQRKVVGSVAEIEQLSGKKVTDLHRPYIDEFTFTCEKCGGVMKRVPDVLDAWMESGSMPYGQYHYPFEHKEEFEKGFPADFIIEYIAQTRAWFYVLHVLSNALFGTEAFKNVISTGVVRGTDGRKMSKSYGNYPDPKRVIEQYGGDALRLYLMSSPVMAGENLNIDEEGIKEQVQRVLTILWNSYKYFVTYADVHGFMPDNEAKTMEYGENTLDQWILLRLEQLKHNTEHYLDKYDIPKAVRELRPFIDDISTWYIRRSRDRFVTGDKKALSTLYHVLYELTMVLAPTTPFIAEELYQNLVGNDFTKPESVHLQFWPQSRTLKNEEKDLLKLMEITREVSSLGNAFRKEKNLPVRQPLAKVIVTTTYRQLPAEFEEIIKDELNVKAVEWVLKDEGETQVDFDTAMTPELLAEGEVRRIVRSIQEARKNAGTQLSDMVTITLPDWPKEFEEEIKKRALVKEIRKGDSLTIV